MHEPYHFECANCEAPADAQAVFEAVFRTDFDAPGFALLDLGTACSPRQIRQLMVNLKADLGVQFQKSSGRRLRYLSMGRFDQQVTTKFHLDGAPEESVLMLGYEPTSIRSRLFMADYSACAHANGISPKDFLRDFNPMFTAGAEKLHGFVTDLREFNSNHYTVLLIKIAPRRFRQACKALCTRPKSHRPI